MNRTAFSLLACCALALAAPLAAQRPTAALTIRAENPLQVARPDEVVSVSWSTVRRSLPAATAERVRVVDAASGAERLSQVMDLDANGQPEELIFLADFWPGETKEYRVEAAAPASKPKPRVLVMHDAHRDDVAWESDRIAYRIYGQGLWKASEFQPLVSSGIDVWPKRVRDLIVERWYKKGHDEYHIDKGEGADFYTVGPALGAGGSAVWRDGKLHRARNFKSYRILANGPVRGVFELEYEPWDAGGVQVSETKRITIDAGQNLYRQEITYRSPGAAEIPYVVGTVKREGLVGATRRGDAHAWLATWGPVERKNGGHGSLGTAVLMEKGRMAETEETDDHFLAVSTARVGVPAVQYVGAGWTASGDFASVEDWWRHLDAFGRRLASPVKVTLAGGAGASGR